MPSFNIATPLTNSECATPNVEQPRPTSTPEATDIIMALERRLAEMHAENKKTIAKIEEERNAERKRWAEEAQALKYVEEFRHSSIIRELKSELSESFQMIAYAHAGGSLDFHEAHRMMEEYKSRRLHHHPHLQQLVRRRHRFHRTRL